jgi:hypothetical protein
MSTDSPDIVANQATNVVSLDSRRWEATAPERLPERPGTVTSLDGRRRPATRPPKEPRKPRREPITNTARGAAHDLRNAIERVERVIADDRFPKNRDQITSALHGELMDIVDTGTRLLKQLERSVEGAPT